MEGQGVNNWAKVGLHAKLPAFISNIFDNRGREGRGSINPLPHSNINVLSERPKLFRVKRRSVKGVLFKELVQQSKLQSSIFAALQEMYGI